MPETEFIPELAERFKSIIKEKVKLSNETIYHYTTFEALEKILKTKRMHFTDYRYLNDSSEVKLGLNKIFGFVLDEILNIPDTHLRNVAKPLNYISKYFDEHYSIYVSCFTTEKSNLALWRHYAKNGAGIALGFGNKFYENLMTSPTEGPQVGRVLYEGEVIKNHIQDLFDECEQFNSENPNTVVESIHSNLMAYLFYLLPLIKDQSFKAENEVRKFCLEENDIGGNVGHWINDQYRDFLPLPNSYEPFVNSKIGNKPIVFPEEFAASDIEEILIGPRCNYLEARTWIRKILNENGYHFYNIKINHIPLPMQ